MSFEVNARPRAHGETLAGLWQAAASGRLPHALMLRGPEGIGKFLAARWLAAGLFCDVGPGWPCGTCGPCKRVASGNHPDLFVVDAQAVGEDSITVPFITPREVAASGGYSGPSIGDFLTLRAMEGGWRVVLVRETERMNVAAQSAFLKTLEEPGVQTLLVLECSRPGSLLDTILSRVVAVALEPLSASDAAAVLADAGVERGEAEQLARWSAGSPGVARRLALCGAPAMRALIAAVARGETHPVAAAVEVWEIDGDFPAKTPAASRRLRGQTFLDVGLELWLDLERRLAGRPQERLPHGDLVATLPTLTGPQRERRREAWLRARQDVALNLSPEALVDRALSATAVLGEAGVIHGSRT